MAVNRKIRDNRKPRQMSQAKKLNRKIRNCKKIFLWTFVT